MAAVPRRLRGGRHDDARPRGTAGEAVPAVRRRRRSSRRSKITLESARYNLGALQRTINTPILSLVFLQLDTQSRFRFTLGKRDPSDGENVWIVDYKEEARPTLVKGARDIEHPVVRPILDRRGHAGAS